MAGGDLTVPHAGSWAPRRVPQSFAKERLRIIEARSKNVPRPRMWIRARARGQW